jgi:hypothetical protein
MAEIENDDTLTGHSYYSKEMMNFKISYSYRNYLEPVLLEANDAAVQNARHIATKTFLFAATILVVSIVLIRCDI